MSENNYANGEIKENEANFGGGNFQGNQFGNAIPGAGPGINNGGGPTRSFAAENNIPIGNRRNYAPGQNQQYNNINRAPYTNPNYQLNYNQPPINNYRGDDRMNYPGNYRGDVRMNYPVNYGGEDDYMYNCPHPYYHDDCDCDYYEAGRPYYRGYRNYRRPRAGYGYPNMQYCDPYYNQGMMPNSWWNPNAITDFINRPRVNNFFRGVGIAAVGLILTPAISRTLRPIVVKAVQGAMAASDELKSIFVDAKEDVEDIFAESKWEGANSERFNHDENEGHHE
jgi:hypothetical protein